LITGASRGIGLAISERFRRAGVKVLAPTRKEMDLLLNESIDEYLLTLKAPVDILINNAGINILAGIAELSDGVMQDTMQTNLLAPLRIVRGIAKGMIKRKYGRIINISSIWGEITKPKRVTYSMSKAALNAMTRTLAVELAPYNILINSVAPGYVNTELTRKNNSVKEISAIKSGIPLKRLAEPEEIAEFVEFLASNRNTYITGQVIIIDGGFICL